MSHIPNTDEQVLSTLNADGTRRWIRPRLTVGPFYRKRKLLAYGLIALFTLIPYLKLNGKPLMLLDVVHRQFTLFGTTFLPTDTVFLMLLMLGIFVTVFLLTAIFGRVWCGWACPQTVYMEYLYRPIERLLEGDGRKKNVQVPAWRTVLKYVLFVVVSMYLAHTFLAYFVGVSSLARWVTQSPFEHPAAFLIMAGTTLLMLIDFAWFREQTCIIACPYGRLQSVLLDRQSMIVGYDVNRGEPRARITARKSGRAPADAGDCVDCGVCVTTCPTGIDIRNGLQMECIGCTQCIDACDGVMALLKKPLGLIRYTSQDELEKNRRKFLRPRVVIYPLILLVVLTTLGVSLARRASADVTILRGIGSPFTMLPSGEVSNQLRIKIVNRAQAARKYQIDLVDAPGFKVVAPENPLPLDAEKGDTVPLFVIGPPSGFPGGVRQIQVRIHDGVDFDRTLPYRILGPEAGQ